MEQIEVIDVISLDWAGDSQHQNKIHEPVRGIATFCHRLVRNFFQDCLDIARREQFDRHTIELGIRPRLSELTRTAQFQGKMAGAYGCNTLVRRKRIDDLANCTPEVPKTFRRRQRRHKDVGINWHDWQIGIRSGSNDWADDGMVDLQLMTERKIESPVHQALVHEI